MLYPIRLLFRLFTLAMVVLAVAVLGGAAFVFYNSTRPLPQDVVNHLATGTFTVQSADREGTGFLRATADGIQLVTAAHVAGEGRALEVTDRDGTRVGAGVDTLDAVHDIAFARLRLPDDWPALPVATALPYPGQKVSTQCFFDRSPREGIFAGSVDDVRVGNVHIPQVNLAEVLLSITDLTPPPGQSILAMFSVEPGCSGAPLLNQAGQVIGVVVAGNDKTLIAASMIGMP